MFKGVQILVWAAALYLGLIHQANADSYLVAPGDKLDVSILGRTEFSRIAQVREDGTFRVHMLGAIEAAGLTLSEIEDKIVKRAAESFAGSVSVIVDVAEYRPVSVLGVVQAPGSYPYAPGMTVIKAVAQAGGYERVTAEGVNERDVVNAQQRVVQARIRLRFAEDQREVLMAELALIEAGQLNGEDLTVEDINPDQVSLVRMGRTILDESIEGFSRRAALATAEAELYAQRRAIIGRQLEVTEAQLADVNKLVSQGLSRKERLTDWKVEADRYRSDDLETTARAASAAQTAANAKNEIDVALTQYHRDLLAAKVAADENIELLRSQLDASMDYLRMAAPSLAMTVTEQAETVFEVFRADGSEQPERLTLTSELRPGDVLVVKFEGVVN
ncbi:polysaccharide biosynthesis/export family protein [Ruegeria atlantica]|uniref:Putative polysaccharide export protein, PEP-CTERM sytem-associated n=1 Tax=Ruegeria atlantica TaxID=81569 RepID=A0A0N7LNE6_9RHOB|nr:polysaccharide biosynthesis/export family protein [Ruegeria atlantica]CUH42204.1 putative polysaccharide export protein, PEP-CTERM sytem-associated [Ruegeria atlantica]